MLPYRNCLLLYPLMVILSKKYVLTFPIYFSNLNIKCFAKFSFFSALTENYLFLLNQFLASEATEAGSIFDDLQSSLSTQQGEMAHFARELRHVCVSSSYSVYLIITF
jgi:hypothetical protein